MAHLLLLPHGWRKMFTKGVRAVCAYLLFFAANQSPANLPVRWVSSRFAILALVLYNDLFEARSWHVDTLGRSCVCAHKVGHAPQSLESARFWHRPARSWPDSTDRYRKAPRPVEEAKHGEREMLCCSWAMLPTLRLHHAVSIEWAARGNPVLTWPGKPAQSHGSLIQFRCCQRCRGSCIQQVWPFFSSQQGAVSCSVQAKLSFLGSGGHTQTPAMLMQNWRTMCWPVGRFVACLAHPMSIMHIFPKIAGPIPVDPRMSMDVLTQEGFLWEECCGGGAGFFVSIFWFACALMGQGKVLLGFLGMTSTTCALMAQGEQAWKEFLFLYAYSFSSCNFKSSIFKGSTS